MIPTDDYTQANFSKTVVVVVVAVSAQCSLRFDFVVCAPFFKKKSFHFILFFTTHFWLSTLLFAGFVLFVLVCYVKRLPLFTIFFIVLFGQTITITKWNNSKLHDYFYYIHHCVETKVCLLCVLFHILPISSNNIMCSPLITPYSTLTSSSNIIADIWYMTSAHDGVSIVGEWQICVSL